MENKKTVTIVTKYRAFNYVCSKKLSPEAIQDVAQRLFPNEGFADEKGRTYYKTQEN